jgi:hypothetical protein
MNQAAEHLMNGQLVKSVAVKVGYRPQHLAEPFRQHTVVRQDPVTPRAFTSRPRGG